MLAEDSLPLDFERPRLTSRRSKLDPEKQTFFVVMLSNIHLNKYRLLALAMLCVVAGCGKPPAEPNATNETAVVSKDKLQIQLDHAIDFTFQKRRLNTHQHGAWQILHGVLAFGREFLVRDGQDGDLVRAVDYVIDGGPMKGWTLRPGSMLPTGRRGLIAVMEPGTKTGQGHADQWLAILAQCGLKANHPVVVGNTKYQISDLISQVQLDVPFNEGREWSWSLIGLTSYLPTDARWKAGDDEEWSIERIVRGELEQDLSDSACGGTHRLIGVTMALNQHLSNGGELVGVWKEADDVIQQNIMKARQFQNPDGSFSSNYFSRGGKSADVSDQLGTTGHILEFLSLAMTEDQLREPWVQRAASSLCGLFERTEQVDLECGALYHAMHGIVLFRQRQFGTRTFSHPVGKLATQSN